MILVGMVIAIGLSYISVYVFGPIGSVVVPAVMFGLVFSTYFRTKEIEGDLKRIKIHFGIINESEKAEAEAENEKMELQKQFKKVDEITDQSKCNPELERLNREIELELEKYHQDHEKK